MDYEFQPGGWRFTLKYIGFTILGSAIYGLIPWPDTFPRLLAWQLVSCFICFSLAGLYAYHYFIGKDSLVANWWAARFYAITLAVFIILEIALPIATVIPSLLMLVLFAIVLPLVLIHNQVWQYGDDILTKTDNLSNLMLRTTFFMSVFAVLFHGLGLLIIRQNFHMSTYSATILFASLIWMSNRLLCRKHLSERFLFLVLGLTFFNISLLVHKWEITGLYQDFNHAFWLQIALNSALPAFLFQAVVLRANPTSALLLNTMIVLSFFWSFTWFIFLVKNLSFSEFLSDNPVIGIISLLASLISLSSFINDKIKRLRHSRHNTIPFN